MAEEQEEQDEFGDLDPEIRARLVPADEDLVGPLDNPRPSGNFKFGRGVHSDTSFQLFVKKRAKSTFVGYVDVTTLAAVTSPQNRGVRVLNVVVNPKMPSSSAFLQNNVAQQLEYLNHFTHGITARRLLLTETLPHHDYERNLGAIADCLSADNQAVRRDAASRLERLLVSTNYNAIHAVRTQLLSVAQKTHDVIVDPVMDETAPDVEHLRMCGHLHLVSVAALMCRAKHRPSLEECRPFMVWPKLTKKQSGSDASQEVLKLMQAFYENAERLLSKEQKTKTAVAVIGDKKKFHKASFCEQYTTLFLSFNQIAEESWSDKAKGLLLELKDIHELMVKESKRWKPEVRTGLDILLIRSLVVVLNTAFAKVRQQIGEEVYDHAALAAQILADVVQTLVGPSGVAAQVRDLLLPHLSTAAFHESPDVQPVVTELLDLLGHSPLHAALDYLEALVSVADLHVPRPGKEPARSASDVGDRKVGTLERRGAMRLRHAGSVDSDSSEEPSCGWHVLRGRFGQDNTECAMLVHGGSCEAKRWSSGVCSSRRPGNCDEWQRHTQNLELLATLSPSKHLVQLTAFQLSPFLFYATECVKGTRLLEHLVNHRAAHRWLSPATLCRIAHDVISALEFLATRHIASREVTAYDILVTGRARRGGRAGEITDVLMTEDFHVKLSTLGLAHHFRQEGSRRNSIVPVVDNGPIPLLWTPPEGILRGEYCEKSMVYSAGCVMYELWTHGCQPFTTFQLSTADTVRMMILMPDKAQLIPWPCISDDVYDVMKRCTSSKPADRPNLKALLQTFMEMHTANKQRETTKAFELEGKKEQTYPAFSDDQISRKHVPERGLPPEIQQIVDDYRINHFESYRNMRPSRWQDYASRNPSANASMEVGPTHWVEIAYQETTTSVREMLTSRFAENELPLLQSLATHAQSHLPGLTDWLTDAHNQPVLETETADHLVHERQYRPAWTVEDAACKGILATSESGYIAMGMDRYVHVLLSIARAVHVMHQAGWLHRDIRTSTVLVDCKTGQATLARLGRMCQVTSAKNYFLEEAFDDSWRWLAPEVLSEGKYTRANDVFMLGTLFWEVFYAREVTEQDPTATETNYLPFADHDKSQILTLTRNGQRLPKPMLCPDWLYDLSIKCRDPDPDLRPTADTVARALEKEYKASVPSERTFLPHPKLLLDMHQRVSTEYEDEHIPPLPGRFKSVKHPAASRDSGYVGELSDELSSSAGARSLSTYRGGSVVNRSKRPVNVSSINLSVGSGSGGSHMTRAASGEYADTEDKAAGYLTPVSKEVQNVIKERESRFMAGGGGGESGGGRGRPGGEGGEGGDVFGKSDSLPSRCQPRKARFFSEGNDNSHSGQASSNSSFSSSSSSSSGSASPKHCKPAKSSSEPDMMHRRGTAIGLSRGQGGESAVIPQGRVFRNVPSGSLPGGGGGGGGGRVGGRVGEGVARQSRLLPALPTVPDEEHVYNEIKDKSAPPTPRPSK